MTQELMAIFGVEKSKVEILDTPHLICIHWEEIQP
jgi:hypothetical protein